MSDIIQLDEDLAGFTGQIADQVESFLVVVRAVARGDAAESAVPMLLLEVSQLLLAGGRLGAMQDVIPDERFEADPGPDPDLDELRGGLARGLRPCDEYAELFDPYADTQATSFRLSDDLAAVAADLVHGLKHYQAGRPAEAMWWWQYSYFNHWGTHGGAALRALHSVVSHARLDVAE